MSLQFEDNSAEVKRRLSESLIRFLYEAGGDLTSQIQQNSRVDTGQTKGSYKYKVNESDLTAIVGSNLENAIWEEFGTGEYALKGNGRKGGWVYEDAKGKYHHTYGKSPNRPMHHAYTASKTALKRRLEEIIKSGMK